MVMVLLEGASPSLENKEETKCWRFFNDEEDEYDDDEGGWGWPL